jgi:hypothetical protein
MIIVPSIVAGWARINRLADGAPLMVWEFSARPAFCIQGNLRREGGEALARSRLRQKSLRSSKITSISSVVSIVGLNRFDVAVKDGASFSGHWC